jgi:hypothetical protein
MSDQQAPPQADTPAVAGPTEAPGTQEQPQVDYEKRYNDLQPEYTRATQRLSELEQQQQWYELAMTTDVERLGMAELDDETRQLVIAQALAGPGVPAPPGAPHDELPDVEAAWNRFQAWRTEEQKRLLGPKQRAPYVPRGGLPANEVPNPGTGHEARMDRAMRALHEEQ